MPVGGIVLTIDPFIATIGGVRLSWYGFAYTAGLAVLWAWLYVRRARLGWSSAQVAEATLLFTLGVLIGGRLLEVVIYEWDWYRLRPWEIPMLWRGGMATHGILLGSLLAALLISHRTKTPLLVLLDELACPAAIIFGFGRLGNFIEGGVIGTPTALPWGVHTPGVSGFRHPVSLYDGLKNLAIVPILLAVLRRRPAGTGIAAATFVMLYGGLRFLVDQLRDYESALFGIGPGQWFNLLMAALGLALLIARRHAAAPAIPPPQQARPSPLLLIVLVLLLLLPLLIPNSWTTEYLDLKRQQTGAPAKP